MLVPGSQALSDLEEEAQQCHHVTGQAVPMALSQLSRGLSSVHWGAHPLVVLRASTHGSGPSFKSIRQTASSSFPLCKKNQLSVRLQNHGLSQAAL